MFSPAQLLAAVAAKPFFDIYSGITGSYIDPLILPVKYINNKKFLSQHPSPVDVLWAYNSFFVDEHNFSTLMAEHNLAYKTKSNDPAIKVSEYLWEAALSKDIPRLTHEELIYAWYTQKDNRKDIDNILKNYGFVSKQRDIMEKIRSPKFDFNPIVQMYYRGYLSKTGAILGLQRLFGCHENDSEKILKTTQFIPPPSDLLRFSVRDVFTNNVDLQKELDSEYDEIASIVPWAKAQGILEKTELAGLPDDAMRDVLKMYWRAHWGLISPTQGYEGFHRLRKDRLNRFTNLIPDIKEFGWTELNQLLKMSDYLPSQRKVLAAISSKQLGRIDLRRLYNDGVMAKDELTEQFKDLGYVDADVKMLVDWSEKQKTDKEKKEKEKKDAKRYGKFIASIYTSYETGSISRQEALQFLLSYDVEDVEAVANLNAIDIRINNKRVQYLIKMIKDEFFLGLYKPLIAYEELTQGGVDSIRANNYVILWQRQLSRPRRMVSINTIIDWLKRGLLSFEDAKNRLHNLGLKDEDTLLYLEMSRMDIQKQINLEQAKQAKTEQQRADEAKRLEKEARANKKSAIADLKSYSPISKIGKWIVEGLMSIEEAILRMQFMEVPQADIERYLIEWSAQDEK